MDIRGKGMHTMQTKESRDAQDEWQILLYKGWEFYPSDGVGAGLFMAQIGDVGKLVTFY